MDMVFIFDFDGTQIKNFGDIPKNKGNRLVV